MATYRVHTNKNYTVMSNVHLRDKTMSLKAKGLLSVMLSLPDTWDYTINGLVAICKENNTAVESALKELKALGYLVVTKRMPNETESGRIEYEYDIYETPQVLCKQHFVNQGIEKQGVENQGVENSRQLSTYKSSTKKSITDKLSTEDKERKKGSTYDDILNAVTDPELKDLYIEYIKMRKMIKAPLTDRALKMLIAKVNELEPNSIDRQKKLLETAIMNNWKSVYPLKDEKPQQARQQTSNNIFLDIAHEEGIY